MYRVFQSQPTHGLRMKYCETISPANLVRANPMPIYEYSSGYTRMCSAAVLPIHLQLARRQRRSSSRGKSNDPATYLSAFLDLRLWKATLRSWGDLSVTLKQRLELVSTVLIICTFYGAVSLYPLLSVWAVDSENWLPSNQETSYRSFDRLSNKKGQSPLIVSLSAKNSLFLHFQTKKKIYSWLRLL